MVSVTPLPLLPQGKTRYPLYRRLGWPQDRSGQVRKISPPPGFDPRTVQPVASRYTDYANWPTHETSLSLKTACRLVQTRAETFSLRLNLMCVCKNAIGIMQQDLCFLS